MRLIIITPYPPAITGIGQYGYHVSRLLARSGSFSQVTVLTGQASLQFADENHIPLEIKRVWRPDKWRMIGAIPAQIKQLQPDLVWFNLGASVFGRFPPANLSGYLSVVQTQQMGFPTVVTLHELPELVDLRLLHAPGGVFARYGARLLTNLATRADVTCVTIQRYADWLAARNEAGKYLHIPIGAYTPPVMLAEPEQPELLFFSSLAPFKGLELLLHSFRQLKSKYPSLRLTVAGAEHIRFPGYLQRVMQEFGDLKDVRWLGQVPEDQVQRLFQGTQLVILPYQASTGSSSVLWQAAMLGRSIIASGLPELHSMRKEIGFDLKFFTPGDVTSLSNAISCHLDDPQLRQKQAQHNMQVLQNYLPQDTCQAYLCAFNLALESHSSHKHISQPVNSAMESA